MENSIPELIHQAVAVFSVGKSDLGSLHPMIVHFPIALFCIVPFFILLGMIFKSFAKPLYASAVILLWFGTLSSFLSVKSGELASESLQPSAEIVETFEKHEHLAEDSRTIFVVLTIVFTLYFFSIDTVLKQSPDSGKLTILVLYLGFYLYGILLLLNAAHYGGKLVHFHGVHTNLYAQPR